MSIFKTTGVRCDWCGKISMNAHGEYTKPDGISCGYINMPEWMRENGTDDGSDICEECAAGRCPKCGSDQVVQTTPVVAGPVGWGGRCKACGGRWGMVVPNGIEHPEPRRVIHGSYNDPKELL
jgi:hypothetical protein